MGTTAARPHGCNNGDGKDENSSSSSSSKHDYNSLDRIIVIGSTCAGKSTLAATLARRLRLTFIELDAIYWLPGWGVRPVQDFRDRVDSLTAPPLSTTATAPPASSSSSSSSSSLPPSDPATSAPNTNRWVIAGNYSQQQDITVPRAQTLVFLDYPLHVLLYRLVRRTLQRWWTQEELWGLAGTREKLWWHFKVWSEESLVHWMLKTFWKRRRVTVPRLIEQYPHLKVVWLRSPRETDAWLERVTAAAAAGAGAKHEKAE
ncbi:hypothetical protein DFJ73DRAFT_590433 [Zopfochytrium polystomum]|nr:hypothetical protein DFJ73DRAFT_590433 [Zopfochytrium polystomum]